MRRKLRHLLVFLIIILEELNTPAADRSWLVSDKPENSSSNESSPISPSRLVLIGSMFGVVPGTILIVAILLTAWYKRRTKEGPNHTVVGTNTNSVMDGGHSQTGQGQSQANNQSLKVGNISHDEVQTDEVESNTMYVEGPTSTNGHNQTGQGQYQAITESNPNTTAAVVTSDHIPTEQGQSQAITESNTNATATTVVVTSDHIRIGQGQYQAITKSNTNTTTAVVTSGHNLPGQGQSQTIIESNANTTITVTSDHIPTGQGQYPNITKLLDAGTKLYGTESTTSQLNLPYETQEDQTGQDQYLSETITNDLDIVNMHYATAPTATASELNSLYENMDTP
ncbi:hypothetical protein Bbelb_064630 [Branchiostoma belcheri]|nr:hypothetical protein Bbelb_064630 [Branchiostoma belcheri]